jgi:putative Ca2+/H+ antiporter (TMEM165/GDT1 family)
MFLFTEQVESGVNDILFVIWSKKLEHGQINLSAKQLTCYARRRGDWVRHTLVTAMILVLVSEWGRTGRPC